MVMTVPASVLQAQERREHLPKQHGVGLTTISSVSSMSSRSAPAGTLGSKPQVTVRTRHRLQFAPAPTTRGEGEFSEERGAWRPASASSSNPWPVRNGVRAPSSSSASVLGERPSSKTGGLICRNAMRGRQSGQRRGAGLAGEGAAK